MSVLPIILVCLAIYIGAYRIYGRWLGRALDLDDRRATPAQTMRDDRDYVPIEPKYLLSQHFSAIAAAGPIVGPILAGVWFGWGPALIWIVIGSIFIGGVHDFTALVASVRHKARSIAEVVAQYVSRRSYLLFLTFIWVALVYIIVAFTDVVASSFVGSQKLEDGSTIVGGATASSSLLYLALPILMALLMRYTKLTMGWATVIFLPLVGAAIFVGPYIPLDLGSLLGINNDQAIKVWDVLLLGYCLVAALVPIWLLLQPRGHLGGYFLYIAMAGALLGILVAGIQGWISGETNVATVQYPAFLGWTGGPKAEPLFPILFITIACGACSGFHCLIASGTTSKQLRRESDARLIGYGAMLMEGMVAVVSLACVMMLVADSPITKQSPGVIYANGLGGFLDRIGIPRAFGYSFGLLAFTTFVYDTLDVCTRLGRYIIQELTGWRSQAGRWFATGITTVVPLGFVLLPTAEVAGKRIPAWQTFWGLFGASNQLLAAMALLGVTVWLWSTTGKKWVWWVTGLPALWMNVMSIWALVRFVRSGFLGPDGPQWTNPVPWAALLLLALAGLVLIEALRALMRSSGPNMSQSVPA